MYWHHDCAGVASGMKTAQLQIRVAPEQKAALRRLARPAGMDVSAYVLSRALPAAERFAATLDTLRSKDGPGFALAELNDVLTGFGAAEFAEATRRADLAGLSPFVRNYVAALVEQRAHLKGTVAPAWTAAVEPLDRPWFAADLPSLRLHLLGAAPVPFKRRNLFVDAAIGARV